MQVHGQSIFTILVSPVVSSDGSRITFATFTEDTEAYNCTLLDDAYYVSPATVLLKCADLDTLLSVNTIVSGLSEAVAVTSISTNSGNRIEGSSGDLFKITVNETNFALCFSSSPGFAMYGNGMGIAVRYDSNRVEIELPTTV